MEKIITTKELAKLYKLCDKFLINKYGTDLVGLFNVEIKENKTETIMMILLQFNEIKQLIDDYGLYEFMYNFIDEYSKKKIFNLSNYDLKVTTDKPENIRHIEGLLTEEQLHNVFLSLEHNLDLYDKLYRDKILLIQSSIGRLERITISPIRLFHMLGFEEKLIKPSNQSGFEEFSKIFEAKDDIKSLLSDKKNLYEVLHVMLRREQTIIDAVLNGQLNHTLNFPKIEMKNYSFERIGVLEHSTGMIFYDPYLTDQRSHLYGDLFLLQDFIRNYNLDFVFESYRPYAHSKQKLIYGSKNNNIPVSDAESLFISQYGENSTFLKGQKSSISEKVGSYHPKSFDYTIVQDSGGEIPVDDPVDLVEFSDEDKMKITQSIIEGLPDLDNSHLIELYNDLQKNHGNNIKR